MAPTNALPRAELAALLGEDLPSVITREMTAFERLTAPFGTSLVLFGAGMLGRRMLALLRRDGIEPLAFADNNSAAWGTEVDGIPVLAPQEAAARFGRRATFVVTIWSPASDHRFKETKRQLQAWHCENVISFQSLAWRHASDCLPVCFMDLPRGIIAQRDQVASAFDLWADDESRQTYVSQLKWRLLERYDALPDRSAEKQYFPAVLDVRHDETFVDCGAFDGDSIGCFLAWTRGNFRLAHAFEPDPANFAKLTAAVDATGLKERIALHPTAVGARAEVLRFATTGTASSAISAAGPATIESVALDDAVQGSDPTFIKMDIEGAEIDALHGARKIIQRATPVLAICAYHGQDHLWKIPLLIASLSDKYRFFLRAHRDEGWDVVCYAIPDARLRPGFVARSP